MKINKEQEVNTEIHKKGPERFIKRMKLKLTTNQ